MGSPASFYEWLQQLQAARQLGTQDSLPAPAPAPEQGPPSLADLARKLGKPGGGFGVLGGPPVQPQVAPAPVGQHPDKFDASGTRWRWNPVTGNYQRVRG